MSGVGSEVSVSDNAKRSFAPVGADILPVPELTDVDLKGPAVPLGHRTRVKGQPGTRPLLNSKRGGLK